MPEKKQFTLTLRLDGRVYREIQVEEGQRLPTLPVPEKKGCSFDGWGELPALMPQENIVVEGHFSPTLYRAIFAYGVEQYAIRELPAGSELKAPADPSVRGYSFVKWDGFDGVMPAKNVTYEASFRPLEYKLDYVVDDTYRLSFSVPYGEEIQPLGEPTKENCEFTGWSPIPSTMPAEDVEVRGCFREKLYHLTLLVDGEVFYEAKLPKGGMIDTKMKPTKEGYYFSGWRKLPKQMPAKDVTVSASMYPTRYRVSFIVNGQVYKTEYVPFGEEIPLPVPPTGEGTFFGGWNDLPQTMPAEDLQIHGSLNAKLYSLSFATDGEVFHRVELPAGAPISKDVEAPHKEGFVFCGWDTTPTQMPPRDLTLHAVYATVRTRYRFLIDGVEYAEVEPDGAEQLVMPFPEERDGLAFSGWNSMEVDSRTGITTFSGTYEDEQKYIITYLLRGEVYRREKLSPGSPITPPIPEGCEDFEFLAWRDLPESMPEADIVIEGEVKSLHYRLIFSIEDEIVYTMSLDAGEDISCPAVANRPGYTFLGWQDVPAQMPAHDLTIYGQYERNMHLLTYTVDGEAIFEGRVGCGELLTPPVPTEKEGLAFLGWSPAITQMPDADTTITALYSDTHCRILYYVDGVLHSEALAPAGQTVPLPSIQVGEGERFEWQSVPHQVPTGLLEVHGGRVANTYRVTYLYEGNVLGIEEYKWKEPIDSRVAPPADAEGYFTGWLGIREEMPAHDLEVTARFESRIFHVTFMLEETLLWEQDVAVGAQIPTPRIPEREGYVFAGWKNYVDVMPPYNFTAYGSYQPRTYTLTYMRGEDVVGQEEYLYGAPIHPKRGPRITGNTFVKWEGLPEYMPPSDLTVSARYRGLTYRLSYILDGELFFGGDVEMGTKLVPLEPPTKDGFTFTGWKDLPTFMPGHEVIVTGGYEHRMYTVTYMVDGIIWRIDHYDADQSILPPEAPEHDHESFVRWKNIPRTMPDYDIICEAEYTEIFRHFAFSLNGKILSEGQCRKGDILLPPEVPYKSGFAFSGWEGFDGKMPAGDVVYQGTYLKDTYKVRYFLDGDLYLVEGYDAGQRILPAEPPSREGYTFSGWGRLPKVMPKDDISVSATMIPNKYRLIYRTQDRVLYDEPCACDTPLGKVGASAVHGYEFLGWKDEPALMPPAPLTVQGSYAYKKPVYQLLTADVVAGEETKLQKQHPRASQAIAFLGEGQLRLLIDHVCYPVPGASRYIQDCTVLDEEGLGKAIRRIYRKLGLPKKSIHLVVSDIVRDDVVYTSESIDIGTLDTLAGQELNVDLVGKSIQHYVLSHNNGKYRVLSSVLDEKRRASCERAFGLAGVSISQQDTLLGALARYLQPNRHMARGENQICIYCLPQTLVGILMLDGQIACMVKNEYPYRDRKFSLETELEHALRVLTAHAKSKGAKGGISLLGVGGIDRTHLRACQKLLPGLLRDLAREDETGVLSQKKLRMGGVVTLGFGAAENRIK